MVPLRDEVGARSRGQAGGGGPPLRVHALIVHTQSRRIRARTKRHIRQVARHREEAGRTFEGRAAIAGVPSCAQASSQPRVGIPSVQRHDQRRTRLPRRPHSRQGPGGLMLVNDVGSPRGNSAVHRSQASCLRGHPKRQSGGERARGGLVDGERHARITHPSRQREHSPLPLRHRTRVRERKVRRGNQQSSLRQSDLHATPTRLRARGADTGGGHAPILRAAQRDPVI